MSFYLEFIFTVHPRDPWTEILMAELTEVGFDSFSEEHDCLKAYIPKDSWKEERLEDLNIFSQPKVGVTYQKEIMPHINWNEEWEKNFSPILVENTVLIRAEFHTPNPELHEIVIQPKMSFGTGHHPTTYLMIQQMLDIDFRNKKILDMGCGTSILGIFAKQKGAQNLTCIDIDEWSIENSKENATRNKIIIDQLILGDAKCLGAEIYEVILANINRNILMSDFPTYNKVLQKGGLLLLSGLCFFDREDILAISKKENLRLLKETKKEEWISMLFQK
ncbi:MAG: 50S ribosomal protein L11 methyltransferase [Bergeyella sp.]|nr:50S ribosomal protein L11 methyltransferase [Bergeyella sp.]